jgi:hypothetical protein
MSTLASKEASAAFCERLAKLGPAAPPQWGRMTAHQMVCHLNDSLQAATGEKSVSIAPSPVPRAVVKFVALRVPMKWPHNVKTRPEIEQGKGGTPPGDWDRDCRQLHDRIRSFADRREFAADHPIFGRMTLDDWQVWAYRHIDHHFRQFGI